MLIHLAIPLRILLCIICNIFTQLKYLDYSEMYSIYAILVCVGYAASVGPVNELYSV